MVFWVVGVVPAAFTVWGVQDVKTVEDSQESSGEEAVAQPVVDEKQNEASRV